MVSPSPKLCASPVVVPIGRIYVSSTGGPVMRFWEWVVLDALFTETFTLNYFIISRKNDCLEICVLLPEKLNTLFLE